MKKLLTLLTAGALSLFSSVHAHQLWSLDWYSNSTNPHYVWYNFTDGHFGGFIGAGIDNMKVYDYLTYREYDINSLRVLYARDGVFIDYPSSDKDVTYDFYLGSEILTTISVTVATKNLQEARTVYVNYTVKSNNQIILQKRNYPLLMSPGSDSNLSIDWSQQWSTPGSTGPFYDISITFQCDDYGSTGPSYLIGIRSFEAYAFWKDYYDE